MKRNNRDWQAVIPIDFNRNKYSNKVKKGALSISVTKEQNWQKGIMKFKDLVRIVLTIMRFKKNLE